MFFLNSSVKKEMNELFFCGLLGSYILENEVNLFPSFGDYPAVFIIFLEFDIKGFEFNEMI